MALACWRDVQSQGAYHVNVETLLYTKRQGRENGDIWLVTPRTHATSHG